MCGGAVYYADLIHAKLQTAGYYDEIGQFDVKEQVTATVQGLLGYGLHSGIVFLYGKHAGLTSNSMTTFISVTLICSLLYTFSHSTQSVIQQSYLLPTNSITITTIFSIHTT